MERGMHQYLEWELYIDPATLKGFDRTFLFFFFFHLVSPFPHYFVVIFQELNVGLAALTVSFYFILFYSFDESFRHHSPLFQLICTAVSTSRQPRLASWLISWVDQLCTANQVEVTK